MKTVNNNGDKLNKLSIFFLILFNIFIAYNIFQWLSFQANLVDSPYDRYDYHCSEFFSSKNLADKDVAIDFKNNFLDTIEQTYSDNNLQNNEKSSELCKKITELETASTLNPEVLSIANTIENLKEERYQTEKTIQKIKDEYEITLTEKIAGQDETNSLTLSNANSSKNDILNLTQQKNNLQHAIDNEYTKLDAIPEYINYKNYYLQNYENYQSQEYRYNLWYQIKIYLLQILFLLPLIIISLYIFYRKNKQGYSYTTIIFSNIAVVAILWLFVITLPFLFQFIPHRLLAWLIELLNKFNLVVIWNYILIIAGIGLISLLIYLSQKKLFSKENEYKSRITNNKCTYCANPVNYHTDTYCGFCSKLIKQECTNCKKQYITWLDYCTHCWYKAIKE